jgi:hypothetical protein
MATEIKVQIGHEVKILEGKELEAFLKQKKLDDLELKSLEKEKSAKEKAKISALTKLSDLGLTAEEIAAL